MKHATHEPVRVVVEDDYGAVSRLGADVIQNELERDPGALLCAASGGSPLGAYRELARRCADTPERFSQLRVIKLDEWGPLAADDPASCEFYVRKEVIEPLRVTEDRYFTLAGDAADPAAECQRYASVLDAVGPIDICVLGLGVNGHLGLNEPGPVLHDRAHVATLATDSQGHGMLANVRVQPSYGLTLGMGDMLRSRFILLLVNGEKKREALRRLLTREITTTFPASLLWLHSNTQIICDREAYPR
ncbi:MAG: 6-phosphogluconolactonase [Candidatus Hydrogenedentes bacterium]|nr:6-phosphogluconolactonase [Candidatus Hydrogenedentota bacterium]